MKPHLDRSATRSRDALDPATIRIVPDVPRAVYTGPLIAVAAALILILTLVGSWSSQPREPTPTPSHAPSSTNQSADEGDSR